MVAPSNNPVTNLQSPQLSAETKAKLENLSEEIDFWQQEIDKAKKVGIDVTALQKQLDQAKELRQLVLKHYQ